MAITTEAQFHVLAVDDSLIDRKLIERLLRTSSYQVTTVDSGSKALEFLGLQDDSSPSVSSSHLLHPQEIEVNLVITDYCMPGMTGYDLLKKIKETSSLKDIPVVIMSSENEPSRINMCLEEGAEEFFLKPVQMSDLERIKPHIMRRKSTEPEEQEQQREELDQTKQSSSLQEQKANDLSSSVQQKAKDLNSIAIATDSGGGGSSSRGKRKAMDDALPSERRRPRCTVTA